MSRVATAFLDLRALRHNLSIVRQAAPTAKILAVIKANAYGHGMLPIAQAISDVDGFAVAHIEEALALREEFPQKHIVLLQGFIDNAELEKLLHERIEIVVHNFQQIESLENAKLPAKTIVWMKIDTGMKRLGFNSDQVKEAWQRLNKLSTLTDNIRLMSHFANADDVNHPSNEEQVQLFDALTQDFHCEKSLANSAALLAWPNVHHQWIRPGIMLYGVSPFIDKTANELNLIPVMRFSTRVISVKSIKKGESVGYGHSWQAKSDGWMAVVGVGYGDGYPRHVEENTPVLINNKRYFIVGRVSMDMICVFLDQDNDVQPGDEVLLWGGGLPVEEIALKAGTIAYELLCQVTQRVRFETNG